MATLAVEPCDSGHAVGATGAHLTCPEHDDALSPTARLIAAARGGDPVALGRLLEAARAYLIVTASRRIPADARRLVAPSDIVQETAIDAHAAFAGFRGSTSADLLAWLRGILIHNLGDALRRTQAHDRAVARTLAGRTPEIDEERARTTPTAPARPTEASAIRRDDAAKVAALVDRLGAEARAVVRMRYWEGLSFVEIGTRLGRSENAVRKLWYRTVARLHEDLHGTAM